MAGGVLTVPTLFYIQLLSLGQNLVSGPIPSKLHRERNICTNSKWLEKNAQARSIYYKSVRQSEASNLYSQRYRPSTLFIRVPRPRETRTCM